jgi:hypothetical protein
MKWIVGISLVAVIVGVAATMTIPAQTVAPNDAILKLFPSETKGIAFFDMAALRNTPLFQDLMTEGKLPPIPPKLAEFAAATGFDVHRDIDRVTAGRISGRRILLVIEARYDKFKVERFLGDHVSRLETHMGRPIYEDRELDAGATFIDNLVIAGYIDGVKKAVEQASLPGSNSSVPGDLLARIRTIEAGNQVWAVGEVRFDELPLGRNSRQTTGPFADLFKSLEGGTYQMRLDTDVHARATGVFTNADSATAVAELGRGMVALMKARVATNQDMLRMLDGVRIDASGPSVVVNIDEPGDLVKKLGGFRPRRALFRR